MLNTNIMSFLFGPTRHREFSQTVLMWRRTETAWSRSQLATRDLGALAAQLVDDIALPDRLRPEILREIVNAVTTLLLWEDIGGLEVNWRVIHTDALTLLHFREMLTRRRRWATDFDRVYEAFCRILRKTLVPIINQLPELCLQDSGRRSAFEVSLVELIPNPAGVIDQLYLAINDDDAFRLDLFKTARERFATNLVVASGFRPETNPHDVAERLKRATFLKGKSGAELSDLYLSGTAFDGVLDLPMPFDIPAESRFEHCHIVGGTGHGKTQLMQRMIYADLEAAKTDGRSVVVIDSQGDLIGKLSRLALFDPGDPGSLANRLVLIDPSDVEHPPALNLFDAKLARLSEYRAVDQERVLNGVVELYEAFFGDMLGAELTQKQGVIFRYLARLMLVIPAATIHTLMQLMEDGRPFKVHMQKVDGAARYFFEREFFDGSFAATKKQILKRLWGVLSTPSFERMFAQKTNKLDLFQALGDGKIILVSTAKDLLKSDGSALLGRFFIALLKQAALERSTLAENERTPVMVYVDEAQEYFDESIETILNQARKYRLSLTLAHQALDQLTPRLRSVLASNTSIKCAGGVSAKDARTLADDLHTSTDFIESMRRKSGRTEFAVSVRHFTERAVRLSVPLGFLERQTTLTEEAYDALVAANRTRYCGTLADVGQLSVAPAVADVPVPAPAAPVQPPPVREFTPEPIPAESAPAAPARPPRPPAEEQELGKGGARHRYLQNFVKGLGEAQGFRATIEAPLPSEAGQVDVLLSRDGLEIAFETSVTTPVEWERENIRKCLAAGYPHIALVLAKSKRTQERYRQAILESMGVEECARLSFLEQEDIPDYLAAFAPVEPTENVVRGYRVKVSRAAVSPEEARATRAMLTKLVVGARRDGD